MKRILLKWFRVQIALLPLVFVAQLSAAKEDWFRDVSAITCNAPEDIWSITFGVNGGVLVSSRSALPENFPRRGMVDFELVKRVVFRNSEVRDWVPQKDAAERRPVHISSWTGNVPMFGDIISSDEITKREFPEMVSTNDEAFKQLFAIAISSLQPEEMETIRGTMETCPVFGISNLSEFLKIAEEAKVVFQKEMEGGERAPAEGTDQEALEPVPSPKESGVPQGSSANAGVQPQAPGVRAEEGGNEPEKRSFTLMIAGAAVALAAIAGFVLIRRNRPN